MFPETTLTEATAFMRATVVEGKVLAPDVEDDNRPTLHFNELAAAGRDLVHHGDDVLRHQSSR